VIDDFQLVHSAPWDWLIAENILEYAFSRTRLASRLGHIRGLSKDRSSRGPKDAAPKENRALLIPRLERDFKKEMRRLARRSQFIAIAKAPCQAFAVVLFRGSIFLSGAARDAPVSSRARERGIRKYRRKGSDRGATRSALQQI